MHPKPFASLTNNENAFLFISKIMELYSFIISICGFVFFIFSSIKIEFTIIKNHQKKKKKIVGRKVDYLRLSLKHLNIKLTNKKSDRRLRSRRSLL